jgi:hypothetical protein
MDRLEAMMERLDKHQPLTAYECLRLVMIAQRAAAFTEANDRSDDADARVEEEGGADSGDTYDALLDAATKADDDYNRSKDELFCATRELMGWPGRPAKYLPEALGGGPVGPHPFAQEGTY